MNSPANPIVLEMGNGAWGILALSLACMCLFYLQHEFRSRNIRPGNLGNITSGMRVAMAMMVLSTGVFISRAVIWGWRYFDGGRVAFTQSQSNALALGSIIGAAGFLFAIREISKSLYGDAPWVLSMVAVLVFCAATAIVH